MGRPPGSTVFVGNIAYDTTEEELREVFSQVGTIAGFRLLHDSQTGRAKGYGFCEYEDKETAMSARRNLNGTIVNGRPLRVDLTDSDKQFAAANGLSAPSTPNPITNHKKKAKSNSNDGAGGGLGLGGLGPGPGPGPGLIAGVGDSGMLPPTLMNSNSSMTSMSLVEIHQTMIHLKNAISQHPTEMRELLVANPRLAHAILQGQAMLGMIPPSHVPPNGPPGPPRQPTTTIPPTPNDININRGPLAPPPSMPAADSQPVPLVQPTPSAPVQLQSQVSVPEPSIPPPPLSQHQGLRPTPVPTVAAVSQPLTPATGQQGMRPQQERSNPQQDEVDEQTAILSRVMNLTPQEIEELAPEHRQYVLQLKQIVCFGKCDDGPLDGR